MTSAAEPGGIPRAFWRSNPGIAESPQGSYAADQPPASSGEQELALSREAMRLKPGNIDQWTDIEDRFYERASADLAVHQQAAHR